MFRIMLFLFVVASFSLQAQMSHNTPTVKYLDAQPTIIVNDNLSSGNTMPLRWAESSQVACFPGTRFSEFEGNHLLYQVQMPAGSKIIITVTPKNKKHRINLYALRLGANNNAVPPAISSAISCEAAYPIYAGQPNYNAPAESQSVEYISIRKPYNILIGVAGATGVTEGDFELNIEISNR